MKSADLFKGMLVLQGHVVRPADVAGTRPVEAATPRRRAPLWGTLRDAFLLLGGRPMHADRPLDVDEPLDLCR